MSSGKFGSANLSANVDTLLYTVPADKTATINIRFANRNGNNAYVRLAIGSGSSPAAADYVTYDEELAAFGILEDTGIVCSAGEKVWARSTLASVSVRVHGMEG